MCATSLTWHVPELASSVLIFVVGLCLVVSHTGHTIPPAYNMEELLKDDIDIMLVSQGDLPKRGNSTIVISTLHMDSIENSSELNAALAKRFRGKTTVHSYPPYGQIVQWILATDGYKVREENLHSISNDDVVDAWEFIDTLKVSSSSSCRDMLSTMVSGRNGESFRRTLTTPKTPPKLKSKTVKAPRNKPEMLSLERDVSVVHDTIDDAIVEDLMHWVKKSEDPLSTCRRLHSSISSGSKSL